MEYWLAIADELADRLGIEFCAAKRNEAAGIMKSAAEVRSDYSYGGDRPVSPAPPPVEERKAAWWEDTSKLCGSDWAIANQIHSLINSR